MSGFCRCGIDTAGGTINGVVQDGTVFVNGAVASVNNDPVVPHGVAPHASPVMIAGSNNVFINGIAVCNAGDLATCGHSATGSSNVFVGD